jgi:predicted nucleic acid-binding protein
VILVDSSVWIEHFRAPDSTLSRMLSNVEVLIHPFVIGEVLLGHLRNRELIVIELRKLPQATMAKDSETLQFIERHKLAGQGIGYVDAHLLASVALTTGSSLWTLDKRLQAAAVKLRLHASV